MEVVMNWFTPACGFTGSLGRFILLGFAKRLSALQLSFSLERSVGVC